MATASAKAMPRIMLTWMVGVASGLRPMAWTAPPVTIPMPAPAPMAPIMASPAPRNRIACRKCSGSFMVKCPPRVKVGCLSLSSVCGRRFTMLPALMADGGLAHEHQGQHGKHIGLNQTDKDFQRVQHTGDHHGRE